MRVLLTVVLVLVTLVLLAWIGLKVRPGAFPAVDLPTRGAAETVRLAPALPAPVARFYQRLYGDEVPVVTALLPLRNQRLRPG